MPRVNIEVTIRKAFEKYGRSLGTSPAELFDDDDMDFKPYFFMENENKTGAIRHCVPYKTGYFDYIVGQEFDSLTDWAIDCGYDIRNVAYGRKGFAFMSAAQLAQLLPPVYHEEPEVFPVDKYITNMLAIKGLDMSNLWVISDGTPVPWMEFTNSIRAE
jgi:hypothetical protein